jgi:Xaa-Pro dipeptidase
MLRRSLGKEEDWIEECTYEQPRREALISSSHKRSISIGGVEHYMQVMHHQPGIGPAVVETDSPVRRTSSMEASGPKLLSGAPKFSEYTINYDLHSQNRRKLIERFRDLWETNTVLLFEGGKTTYQHDSDTEHLFRQESNFQYLFGVAEQDFFGLIDLNTHHAVLFCPKLPADYAVWLGAIQPTGFFKEKYMVDEVHFVDDLPAYLVKIGAKKALALKHAAFSPFAEALQKLDVDRDRLKLEIGECRVIKTDAELNLLRYVNQISSWAHIEVMKLCRVGMNESELEALFRFLTYKNGRCRHQSYICICASGKSSSVLHYPHNDKVVENGQMMLLDMGAEYHCYCSDITNSFPTNGRFTQDQREVYDTVLAASRAVMHAMKPGVKWEDMHRLAERTILEKLKEYGFLQGDVAEMIQHHVAALFFPHGLGHFMGLDTHDVGGYPPGVERIPEPGIRYLRARRTLEKGMVITVEPGVYFIDALLEPALRDPILSKFLNDSKISRFRTFGGVRIEDDVIVTANGIENMTQLPRTVEEIEAVMAQKRADE